MEKKKETVGLKFMKKVMVPNFFKINLTSVENEIAYESIEKKYLPSIKKSIFLSILCFPALLFLDTTTIVSVLIPITLVSGTAWFSISLADIKKKFEKFGLELTTDVFESFSTSSILLILISLVSLFSPFTKQIVELGQKYESISLISAILGVFVISFIIYKIFLGALKFDINDAMLAGQNEAAEKYFKKSLSFLNITAKNLQAGKGLQVANYYIGLSFFEIYTYILSLKIKESKSKISKLLNKANELINNPSMNLEKADKLSIELIETFLNMIKNKTDKDILKSYNAICDELKNLKDKTKKEEQVMVDTRFSIIFQEISEMLDNGGESLFLKSK
jgi:hypothetical protein